MFIDYSITVIGERKKKRLFVMLLHSVSLRCVVVYIFGLGIFDLIFSSLNLNIPNAEGKLNFLCIQFSKLELS